MMKSAIEAKLRQAGQEHTLAFWDALEAASQEQLLGQLDSVDLALVARLWAKRQDSTQDDWQSLAERAEPLPAIRLGQSEESRAKARQEGEAALREGKVAMLLVAGGQGTRLGFEHPKGMFPLGPVSGRSLYQMLLEQLLAARKRYDASLPLYVMTSPATHDETGAYLAEHDYFGLPAEDVRLFCQGMMPAVDAETGKLLLSANDSLALGPDGHGGMLAAFEASGCLQDAQNRGVEQLYYCQVDNPLVQCCEPELLGYHLLAESEMTTQAVARTDPTERVGNIVSIDGRLRVIEYSDLPEDAAQAREPDGSLRLWAGNIAVHVFSLAFLARQVGNAEALPYHLAHKATPFLDSRGELVAPKSPNAIKFERFIFDLLPAAANGLVVEVSKQDRFAPVKNAEGADSDTPAHSRVAICDQHRSWLRAAGVTVEGETLVEISPLFAWDAEELAGKVTPGDIISTPTYLK